MEKGCELAAFNGSVVMHCTRGEISSCCRDEPYNILALNLAHDIIEDKKNFEQARQAYVDSVLAFRRHRPAPYMEQLQFIIESDTADPDECVISRDQLNQAQPA
jgi:hypothetical protein